MRVATTLGILALVGCGEISYYDLREVGLSFRTGDTGRVVRRKAIHLGPVQVGDNDFTLRWWDDAGKCRMDAMLTQTTSDGAAAMGITYCTCLSPWFSEAYVDGRVIYRITDTQTPP